jgi:hypothetical protein
MVTIPLGAEVNLGLQLVSFLLILVGLRYAIKTHRAYSGGKDDGAKFEGTHKNLMTTAVVISGLGAVIWMVPNLFFGWFYGTTGLGYGTGGYQSYFSFTGAYYEHWYLLALMAVIGTVTAVLGVYLVLRMRWSRFPERLKVQNYRAVMITTWSVWTVNMVVGALVFYFFAFLQTG